MRWRWCSRALQGDQFELARKNLWLRNIFLYGGEKIVLACLIRDEDTRPLKVPWWKRKEVYLIGVDLDGNFLLRHCDVSVRYWDHEAQSEQKIASSVDDLVFELTESEE